MTDGGVSDDADRVTDGDAASSGGTAAGTGAAGDDGSFTGSVLRRALRQSRRDSASLTLRSYVWVSALVGLLLVLIVLLALPVWIAQTVGHSALNKIGRGLLPVIVLALLVPLFAPAVYAARNHRREAGTRRGDAALGLAGYLYVLSIYLALVVSAPPDARTDPSGALAPAIDFLYGLPRLSSLLAPVLGAALIVLVQRIVR